MRNIILFSFLNIGVFIIFLIIYYLSMMFYPESWDGLVEPSIYTLFDAFYVTSAIHTHTGYSQIKPNTRFTRFISSIHMIIVFCLIIGPLNLYLYTSE